VAEFYGNKVGHWSVYTTCGVNQQNNGAVQLHIQTYFQTWDQWDYYGLDAEYSHAVNGSNRSVYTDGGINVARNARQQLLDDYVWVNRGRNAINIPFNSHINVNGYAAGWSAGSGSISIGAKPSYTVSYNANGGTGAPGSQRRWWGEVINLSNTKPTRTNYEFLGWSTSAGGGVNYPSGARYGEDTSRTLYAVWKLSLVAPSLSNVSSWRSDSSGNQQNDGTYVTVEASWSVDTKVDSNNSGMKMVVNAGSGDDTTTLSGASGTYQKTFANKDIANSYTFTVTLTDKHMSVSATTMVGPAFFLLDINPTGTAIGIGQAAPVSGLAVGGTYFATDISQLPKKDLSSGSKAFVNGLMYLWLNNSWQLVDQYFSDPSSFLTWWPGHSNYSNRTWCKIASGIVYLSVFSYGAINHQVGNYARLATIKPGFYPKQGINTTFAFGGGDVAGGYISDYYDTDGQHAPGVVMVAQPFSNTKPWAGAMFIFPIESTY
jgi:hypothetical protein